MLVHRQTSVLKSVGAVSGFAASYLVVATPVGARASASSSAATVTVDSGHSFVVGDKAVIFRPSSGSVVAALTASVQSATATSIVFSSGAYSVSTGDVLVNVGADSGTGSPNYDASPMKIYSDPDGGTAISNSTLTTNSVGQYEYWHKGDGMMWELVRSSTGDPLTVVEGHGGIPTRFNVCDFGAAADASTDDAARVRAAIVAAEGRSYGGEIFFPAGEYIVGSELNITGASLSIDGSHHGSITLRGVGRSQSKITAKSDFTAGNTLISYNGASSSDNMKEVGVFDLWLDGNARDVNLLDFNWVTRSRVERVLFRNTTGNGFHMQDGFDVHLLECFFEKAGGDGTHYGALVDCADATSTINQIRFVACRWERCLYSGVAVGGLLKIDGSAGSEKGYEIFLRDCKFHGLPTAAERATRPLVLLDDIKLSGVYGITAQYGKGPLIQFTDSFGVNFVGGDLNGDSSITYLLSLSNCDESSVDSVFFSTPNGTATAYISLDATTIDFHVGANCYFDGTTTPVAATAGAQWTAKTRQDAAERELTIASGVIAVRPDCDTYSVDTESNAATDDLDTITPSYNWQRILLVAENSSRAVVVKNGTGNIQCGADITLKSTQHSVQLVYSADTATWLTLNRMGFTVRAEEGSELTIASGVVTAARSYHTIDTEADASTDDLDTISGGEAGMILVVRASHTDRTVVLKDGSGNLALFGDCVLDNTADTITLIFGTTTWIELSRSKNAEASVDVNVTGNDAIVSAGKSLINLTNVSGTNTITLDAPTNADSRILVLRCAALTAGTLTLADSGTVSLSAAWVPDANDTLTLIARSTVWYEMARSAN